MPQERGLEPVELAVPLMAAVAADTVATEAQAEIPAEQVDRPMTIPLRPHSRAVLVVVGAA